MQSPLVSIIIPCFNDGKFLYDSVNSVKEQTYSNWEIVIINDGSTDIFTIELLEKFRSQNIKIISKENEGLAAARNTGIQYSNGEFILPLDADDKIGPDYLKEAIKIFNDEPQIGIVFCQAEHFGNLNTNLNKQYISYKQQLLYNSLFATSIFRKSDAIHVGLYNTNMKKGMEDWDFWIRLLKFNPYVVQIPSIQFFYRKHGDSMWDGIKDNVLIKIEMENQVFINNINEYFNTWGSMIEVLRNYEILKNHNSTLEKARNELYNTISYKLGSIILSPFKFLRNSFKSKNDK